jgi:hypothetical protein
MNIRFFIDNKNDIIEIKDAHQLNKFINNDISKDINKIKNSFKHDFLYNIDVFISFYNGKINYYKFYPNKVIAA